MRSVILPIDSSPEKSCFRNLVSSKGWYTGVQAQILLTLSVWRSTFSIFHCNSVDYLTYHFQEWFRIIVSNQKPQKTPCCCSEWDWSDNVQSTCDKMTASSSSQATALWHLGRNSGAWALASSDIFLRSYVVWHRYDTWSYGTPVLFWNSCWRLSRTSSSTKRSFVTYI